MKRRFGRDEQKQLWVTDITKHPTCKGNVYGDGRIEAHVGKAADLGNLCTCGPKRTASRV